MQEAYIATCPTLWPVSINAPHTGCKLQAGRQHWRCMHFNLTHPRAGRDGKTIQSKYALVAHRMYGFANYVLHILKHSPTYCIGTTLQPLFFGAKLPAILC